MFHIFKTSHRHIPYIAFKQKLTKKITKYYLVTSKSKYDIKTPLPKKDVSTQNSTKGDKAWNIQE